MLGQLRAMSALAASDVSSSSETASSGPDFASVLQNSINEVNKSQVTAETQQQQFELHPDQSNLQDVMISLQKASLSFQTMVQVRNKLVAAYQDVMNTQV